MDLREAVARIPDGASVGLGHPAPLALVRELARLGRRDLHVINVPTGGLATELLIASGSVGLLETSAVDLAESGPAPAFAAAVREGRLRMRDTSCPALLMALQAGASGIPFTPVPGLFGSDLLGVRPDFRIIDDPYRPGTRVVLVPAVRPDFALVHGLRGDPSGNAVIGIGRDDRILLQAARFTIVSVEEMAAQPITRLTAGEQLVPAAYIDVLLHAPNAISDADAIQEYLQAAALHS